MPVRWSSADPASLELVRGTAVNCLLVEEKDWSGAFIEQAAKSGVQTLALLRPSTGVVEAAGRAKKAGFTGAVLEGDFEAPVRESLRRTLEQWKMQVIELPSRTGIRFESDDPIVGTSQGLWPGVQADAEGKHKAAPSGAAWIDTNTGFLRYARAATQSTVWLGNLPPAGAMIPAERYLQAIGDAAMTGARWVVSLDAESNGKLLAGDKRALADWKRITGLLHYFEEHKEWRGAQPFAQLALVEDAHSGALLSGGVLDMIAVKHTPVRPVPPSHLKPGVMEGAKLAVNVDPSSLNDGQKDVLKAFTRTGGTLLTGPPGWKFPEPRPGQIVLEKGDLGKLDEIWRELNSLTGRKNLGARLFNVSTMLSNLQESADRSKVILQLVNYSDYPVENLTVHVLGRYKSAYLYRPGGPTVTLEGYEVEDGTGLDVDQVGSVATLVLTR